MATEAQKKQWRQKALANYRKNHPDRVRASQLRYKRKNREKIRRRARQRYMADREHYIRASKRRRAKLPWFKLKEYKLVHGYGLTFKDYVRLLVKQKWKCSVCQRKLTKKTGCVDYCHRSKKVRAVLCRRCNLILGLARDSVEVLRGAAKYLQRFRGDL